MRVTAGAALSSFSATALTKATPTLPFGSDFTTATSPEPNQLTSNWINQAGNFSVNSSTGTATGLVSDNLATLPGLNTSIVALQINVTLASGEMAGLVADYTGSGDGSYYFGSVQATANSYQANLYRASSAASPPSCSTAELHRLNQQHHAPTGR